MKDELLKKIEASEAVVGIIGLGYVGLPLLIEFARRGFSVLGLDVDERAVEDLLAGRSYIRHIEGEILQEIFRREGPADASTDFSRVAECDALLICVPTPLTAHRDPDLTYITSTAETIAPFLKKGQLVVLESTTYPGTTEEELAPRLEAGSGLTAGTDVFVAYSPEREDPNNAEFSTATIPKVVGGFDEASLAVAAALYDRIVCRTVPVANCRTAEATKLMENIFRCVNIALVNELKIIFEGMDIDVWEVIRAASTKPFGYMPFYPGPGLGGHCIPIDPFYLTWKARESGLSTRFIELAGEINVSMPDYVIHRTMLALNDRSRSLRGSRVLLVGLAYKKNVDDDRESPTYALWKRLLEHGAEVSYFDPFCPVVRPSREHSDLAGVESTRLEEITAENFDLAIISTAHDGVDHDQLAAHLPLVIDTRGICRPAENVISA